MAEQGSHCLECGPDVRVDGDGCCAGCGRWSMWHDNGECMCADVEDGPCPQCLHKLAALEAENERLSYMARDLATGYQDQQEQADSLRAERDAALAKVERLRKALHRVSGCVTDHCGSDVIDAVDGIIRAALNETEADR